MADLPRECINANGFRKNPYDSKVTAKRMAKFMSRKGRKLHAYRCSTCTWWHIGRPSLNPIDG